MAAGVSGCARVGMAIVVCILSCNVGFGFETEPPPVRPEGAGVRDRDWRGSERPAILPPGVHRSRPDLPPVEPSPGSVTGVQMSDDRSKILISFDGTIGKHSTSVLARPARVVIDIDPAVLGSVPPRARPKNGPIEEIRVGSLNTRVRVVLDFGSHPVPAFRVQRTEHAVAVVFGKSLPKTALASTSREKPPAPFLVHTRSPKPQASPGRTAGSTVQVKTSGVRDNLVFVELGDRSDPRRSFHLVMDVDVQTLRVKHVSLSDAKGNLKRYELSDRDASRGMSENVAGLVKGPRKGPQQTLPDSRPPIRKYQWGEAATQPGPVTESVLREKMPFRIEQLRLERRKSITGG